MLSDYNLALDNIEGIANAYAFLSSDTVTMGSLSVELDGNTLTFEETSAGVWVSTSGLINEFNQVTIDAIAAGAEMTVHYGGGYSLVKIGEDVWQDSNGAITDRAKAESLNWGIFNTDFNSYDAGTDIWTLGDLY